MTSTEEIKTETNDLIEQIFQHYKSFLKEDFEKYRNHVYRVYLLCTILDSTVENKDKYAIAAAFHDMGIWTDNTFDYLKPSIALANNYLVKQNRAEWSREISLMIDIHHKITRYTGEFEYTVEIFRKADCIDVTKGLISFGVDKMKFRQLTKQFPVKGFHGFLVKKTLQNFLSHPLNPIPMFKR